MRVPLEIQSAIFDTMLIHSKACLLEESDSFSAYKLFSNRIRIYLMFGHTFKCCVTSVACSTVYKALCRYGFSECPQNGVHHTCNCGWDWRTGKPARRLPKVVLTCISQTLGIPRLRMRSGSLRQEVLDQG